jgi:hypothetical protein
MWNIYFIPFFACEETLIAFGALIFALERVKIVLPTIHESRCHRLQRLAYRVRSLPVLNRLIAFMATDFAILEGFSPRLKDKVTVEGVHYR